jgi:hypothetical protein
MFIAHRLPPLRPEVPIDTLCVTFHGIAHVCWSAAKQIVPAVLGSAEVHGLKRAVVRLMRTEGVTACRDSKLRRIRFVCRMNQRAS